MTNLAEKTITLIFKPNIKNMIISNHSYKNSSTLFCTSKIYLSHLAVYKSINIRVFLYFERYLLVENFTRNEWIVYNPQMVQEQTTVPRDGIVILSVF